MRILQIQGLRALAALLVTIFHARLLPGGFIGVDIFYADKHGNIHSEIFNKDYDFVNHFFKVQLHMPHGKDFLAEDIGKGIEKVQNTDGKCFYFDSYFLLNVSTNFW